MSTIASTQSALQAADNSLQRAYDTPTGESDKLGKDDFLKLMMAQVSNQDPLNPMDSQGMMDQLTAMGSLEQLVNIIRVANIPSTPRWICVRRDLLDIRR